MLFDILGLLLKHKSMIAIKYIFKVSLSFVFIAYSVNAFANSEIGNSISSEFKKTELDLEFDDAEEESPLRMTLAQEFSYKLEDPSRVVKNRSIVRMEYSKYLLDSYFLQLDAKATVFLGEDHWREAERSDATVYQSYIQTSFNQTSIKAGIQTLAWGESILAAITDEISPRDSRELFNFNLEDLRLGQLMLSVDQYSKWGRWNLFYIPKASFNEYPKEGSAYFFDNLNYQSEIERENSESEFGGSWNKNFDNIDITIMAANLIDNNFALRMNDNGLVTRKQQRYTLSGAVFSYALNEFVIRGEVAWKSPKTYNDAEMKLIEKNAVDTYLAVEYVASSTLTLSLEVVNQHIVDWSNEIQSAPKDRQSLLLNLTKLLVYEDLSINFLNFYNKPYSSNLTMLLTKYNWNDNLVFGIDVIYPHSDDERSDLWSVRDQKQIAFKIQYQF